MYAPLAEMFERSAYYASKATCLESTFVLDLVPNASAQPSRTGAPRPGGYFILNEAEGRARRAMDKENKTRWWYDIALTAEFKKDGSTEDLEDVSSCYLTYIRHVKIICRTSVSWCSAFSRLWS